MAAYAYQQQQGGAANDQPQDDGVVDADFKKKTNINFKPRYNLGFQGEIGV